MQRVIIAIIVTLLALSARAAHAVEFTDTWWNPGEPGWGVNIVHQDEIAFVTLYLYGPNGDAQWYASDARTTAWLEPGGLPQLTGTLYRSRGPRFGGPFDGGAVSVVPVGTLYLSPRSLDSIDLEYTIDGVRVVTTIERYTWRQGVHSEGYMASFAGRRFDAASKRTTAFGFAGGAFLEIDNGLARLRMRQGSTLCDYLGAHRPTGRIAAVTGGFQCDDGRSGFFELTDLSVTDHGFNGRLRTVNGYVSETGAVGGGTNPMHRMADSWQSGLVKQTKQ